MAVLVLVPLRAPAICAADSSTGFNIVAASEKSNYEKLVRRFTLWGMAVSAICTASVKEVVLTSCQSAKLLPGQDALYILDAAYLPFLVMQFFPLFP